MGVVGTGVERVAPRRGHARRRAGHPVSKPYKLASAEHHPDRTQRPRRDVEIGAGAPLVGHRRPVRGRVARAGAGHGPLGQARGRHASCAAAPSSRAPRPYAFQGLGVEGARAAAPRRATRPACRSSARSTDPADVRGLRAVRRHAPGRRPQHGRTSSCSRRSARAASPVLLKRGLSRDDRGVAAWPPSTSSRRATRTSSCASAASAPSRPRPATRSTSRPCPSSASAPTCRSSSTRRTAPGTAPWLRPMAVAGAAVGRRRPHHRGPSRPAHGPVGLASSRSRFPEFGDLMDDLRRHEYLRQPTAPGAVAPPSRPASDGRLRGRIDDVDARIAALLEERAELARRRPADARERRPRPRRRPRARAHRAGRAHRRAAS